MSEPSSHELLSRAIFFDEAPPKLTSETRDNLRVYRDHHIYTLTSSLRRKYHVVAKFLTESNFLFFAREYALTNPSVFHSLDFYGSSFSQFLKKREELKDFIYLYDLAQMDWFYFNAGKKAHSIVLPMGIYDFWDAVFRDLDTEDIDIQEGKETLQAQIVEDHVQITKKVL